MTQPSPERLVDSVVDLLRSSELVGVRTYRVAGSWAEAEATDRPEGTEQELHVSVRGDATWFETRVAMVVRTPEADFAADVGVRYDYAEPLSVPQEIMSEFVERVGVMAVFPFLRESIFTTATRLGAGTPVIGLLRAGDFHLSPPDSDQRPEDI